MKIKKKFIVGLDATCITDRPSGAKQRFIGLYSELVSKMEYPTFNWGDPLGGVQYEVNNLGKQLALG